MARSAARNGVGANQESARRHNLSTLLRHLHRAGRLSRSSLTAQMGLNRSTIAGLVNQLETLGLARQLAPDTVEQGAAGRPSVGVCVTDHAHVLAVDIRVSGLTAARVGLGGRVLSQASGPPAADHDPLGTVEAVGDLARTAMRDAAADSVLVGIGVSVPGTVTRGSGVVRLAPNLGWHDVALADLLADRLGTALRPALGNDSDHGALAEHRHGAGRGIDDVVYLFGEVGVGAGVIAGGLPVTGACGVAGEIGHVPFGDGSRRCHCGAIGCWETEIGAAAMAAAVGCPEDRLVDLARYLSELSSAPAELHAVGHQLGRGLASLVNLLNPEMIILGGYLPALYRLVRPDVEAEITARALRIPETAVRIAPPLLGDHSVLVGAAEVAFRGLLEDPVGQLDQAPRTAELFTQKIE